MKTFFRDEMLVTSGGLTIPSHQKAFRLLARLKQHRQLELVDDFHSLPPNHWTGIHEPSYLRAVLEADPDTFVAEGYWTSADPDWLIYASHEMTITIGGWMLDAVKCMWPEWSQHEFKPLR